MTLTSARQTRSGGRFRMFAFDLVPLPGAIVSTRNPPQRQGLYDPADEHESCGMGFVAHLHGVRSREVVVDALTLLGNLAHRGAAGADAETGDGAGILLQIPHAFLRRQCAAIGVRLPEAGEYGVAMVFLPRDGARRADCERIITEVVAATGCR